MDQKQLLKFYFGHDAFRPGQEEVISQILQGRDVLCVMPTGAGKSICYQIPALLLPGITLVVSPLISLMKDQVRALTQAGIRAAYINSSLTYAQYRKVLQLSAEGTYKIIYVAPERLLVDHFIQTFANLEISMIAIDEAHCVSQWGQDFRPSYLKILSFLQQLPYRPQVAAFTATATNSVKADIADILQLQEPFLLTTGFDRPNLYFAVLRTAKKQEALLDVLKKHQSDSGIIYCATRKAVMEVCDLLVQRGYPATRYHAGLSDKERHENQDDFIFDRKPIMVATNAFGMGIDKSDVSFVVHYNMPKNIESYYQEAGRAGRDGSGAECILLYSPQDVHLNRFLIEHAEPNPELEVEMQQSIREKDLERLKYMTFYATTADCLRGFLLKYFGEKPPEFCGNCSNCAQGYALEDLTDAAKAVLDCVEETDQRYGAALIADILHGSKNKRILENGLDVLCTYGALSRMAMREIRGLMEHLLQKQYLDVTPGEYPVLRLTPSSATLQMRQENCYIKRPQRKPVPQTEKKSPQQPVNHGLLLQLKQLRTKLAQQNHVPAYVIFSDATLNDMCQKLPTTPARFLDVSGVGEKKLERYGEAFLEVIRSDSVQGTTK